MTSIVLLAALASLLTFDACFTARRMNEIGIDVELNPVVRWLSRKLGATLGSAIGIVVPHGFLYSLFFAFECNLALSFFCGIRTMLTIMQLISQS